MSDIETLFEPTELLLTIACDGNRRGEVNMVQKSAGFSWSSAGVSTCRWKGALIRDVLKKCGVEGESKDGKRLYLK
jgi:nitrate reductase (NAD(P)H)